MHKELIIAAFEKAREDLKRTGIKTPSNHQAAIHISDFIGDEADFSISKKSISTYYKSAMEIEESEDINISQLKVVQGLCKYLGFTDYREFIINLNPADPSINHTDSKNKIDNTSGKKGLGSRRSILVIISIGLIIIVTAFFIKSATKQRWMIWNVNHYEEVDFNKEELANGSLKLYKEERIENFKKIDKIDCAYEFFNEDGSVKVWYGKNKNGDLEIFNDIGLHPETGKSLKPITVHMIRKYLCETYK